MEFVVLVMGTGTPTEIADFLQRLGVIVPGGWTTVSAADSEAVRRALRTVGELELPSGYIGALEELNLTRVAQVEELTPAVLRAKLWLKVRRLTEEGDPDRFASELEAIVNRAQARIIDAMAKLGYQLRDPSSFEGSEARPISELGFITPVFNVVDQKMKLSLAGELILFTEQEVMDYRNIGEVRIKDVVAKLAAVGLRLRPSQT